MIFDYLLWKYIRKSQAKNQPFELVAEEHMRSICSPTPVYVYLLPIVRASLSMCELRCSWLVLDFLQEEIGTDSLLLEDIGLTELNNFSIK